MSRQVVLFTPGDEERMVKKALDCDADMVILDIEDSVAPASKEKACETIRKILLNLDVSKITVEVAVRINPLTDRGEADISSIQEASDKINNIVLPKVRSQEEINDLVGILDDEGFDALIIPLIETPEAVLNIDDIVHHPLVVALEFGAEDYTTELGATQTQERDEIIYARQKISAAAAAADIDAVDMAWPDFHDEEGLKKNAKKAVQYGYDGMSAIHPNQIEVIRDAFTPTDDQIHRSKKIVEAADEAQEEGKVVFQLNGEMIDPPIINRAYDILERSGVSINRK